MSERQRDIEVVYSFESIFSWTFISSFRLKNCLSVCLSSLSLYYYRLSLTSMFSI